MTVFNESVIRYFHFLESILNDDSFKEYMNPVVFIKLKYILSKNVYLFPMVAFKTYAIMKTVDCFN